MEIKTVYKVEQMVKWQEWEGIHSGKNEFYANNIARGTVTNNPKIPVRILETKFKNGKLFGKIKEYGVSPPIWSGRKETPERSAEIFFRGYLDIDDLSKL